MIISVLLVGVTVFAALSGAAANDSTVLWSIRAPRISAALLVGAGLAVAGVLLQGSLRNPLADPALVGVSAGAALGTVAGVSLGLSYNSWGASVAAIVGATICMWAVLWIAQRNGRIEVVTVLLGGIAITAFAAAVVSVVVSVTDQVGARSVTFWTTGSFALSNWAGAVTVIPAVLVGLVIAFFLARSLDVLALGDDSAASSGIDVSRTRYLAIFGAVLLTATGVAVVGIIAFIGLLIPHALRLIMGPSHRPLLLVSAIAGALAVLVADTIARLAFSPAEIPVGAVTAIVGAPLFFLLIAKTRTAQGGWA